MVVVRTLKLFLALWIFVSVHSIAEVAENAINSTLPIHSGDCLIIDKDNHILMIDETISGKFSIPGGSIVGDEAPEIAAKRETFEETGLRVTVGKQIARIYNSAIFTCELDTPAPYYIDENGRRIVMVWTAPHFGKEVTRVLLLPDNQIMRDNYRFPEHKWNFSHWIPHVKSSTFIYDPGATDTLIPFYQWQLEVLQSLHKAFLSSETTIYLGNVTIFLGSLFSPLFFLLTLAFIRSFQGYRAVIIYGSGMLTMSVITLILTTLIVIPRPFFVDPIFGQHETLGYTLPSTMIALTTLFFTWLCQIWKPDATHVRRKWMTVLGVVSVLMVSGKVLLQGEHYPSDVIVSIFMGLAGGICLHHAREWRYVNRCPVLISIRYWLCAFALVACTGLLLHKPHIIYLSALCLGVFSALLVLKLSPVYVSLVRRREKWSLFGLVSAGVLIIIIIAHCITEQYAVNTTIVLVNCIALWSVSIWLLVISPRVLLKIFRL